MARLPQYEELLSISGRQQWDPEDVDLRQDRESWRRLPVAEREPLAALLGAFLVGESAVAREIRVFAAAPADPAAVASFVAQQGEEERHQRFFVRVHEEVLAEAPDVSLARARGRAPPALVDLLEQRLPETTRGLVRSSGALPECAALYHGIVEGVVFLAGLAELRSRLDGRGALPGLREGVVRVHRDERWHVALGARVLADAGASLDPVSQLADGAAAAGAWGPLVSADVRDATVGGLRRRLRAAGVAPPQAHRGVGRRQARKSDN